MCFNATVVETGGIGDTTQPIPLRFSTSNLTAQPSEITGRDRGGARGEVRDCWVGYRARTIGLG